MLSAMVLNFTLLTQAAKGDDFSIDWFVVGGGGGTSGNGTYAVSGTIGQPATGGSLSGGAYTVTGGFWAVDTIGVTVPSPPSLQLATGPNGIHLYWPATTTGFVLERSVGSASGPWTPVNAGVSNDGTFLGVDLAPSLSAAFFRLKWTGRN